MELSFEQLPEAVGRLFVRLDELEKLIKERSTPQAQDQFLDIHEAGQLLRLSPQTIYGLVHKREIPHHKKGNRLYFLQSELQQWMKAGRRKTMREIQGEATLKPIKSFSNDN